MLKTSVLAALGAVLLTGTALADEYRGDVFAPGYSELDIDFNDSKYNNQLWQRPGTNSSLKYHDTLIILSQPGCVRLETGAPPPNTSTTDTMFYLSYSNDANNNDWGWLDDDSGTDYLSIGFLRYSGGNGQRRVRVRTTGYDTNINGQRVNIHISHLPLADCPANGSNVAFL